MGLYATRSFYLNVPDSDVEEEDSNKDDHHEESIVSKRHVRIGLWHVLPKHVAKRFAKELQLSEVSVKFAFCISRTGSVHISLFLKKR